MEHRAKRPKMSNSLTAFERETTINWNRQDDYATVDTRDGTVIGRLERMGYIAIKERVSVNDGALLGKLFHVPKNLVRLPKPPNHKKKVVSESQKEAMRKRMADRRAANNL